MRPNDKKLAYLYDVEWQILRVNMLGTWGMVSSARTNYDVLTEYYHKAVESHEAKRRLWRIVNYLNAVRMGYSGQKMYGSDVDNLLVEKRKFFQDEYALVANVDIGIWDWEKVEEDFRCLVSLDIETFNRIHDNLNLRRAATLKRRGDLDYRNELVICLTIMDRVSK